VSPLPFRYISSAGEVILVRPSGELRGTIVLCFDWTPEKREISATYMATGVLFCTLPGKYGARTIFTTVPCCNIMSLFVKHQCVGSLGPKAFFFQ
jgi:hypothetical protein